MDIKIIREFLLLSRTLNYRIAADSLFITQSTLSKHIKALENELGCELLSRNTKEVTITENGRTFREYAERIVNEYDMACEVLSDRPIVRGTLRIAGAIRFPVINDIVSEATDLFERKYPDVSIVIEDIQWEDFRVQLLKSIYDIVFTVQFPGINTEGMDFTDICTVPLCVWVNKESPLVQKERVGLDELTDLNMRILNPQKSETYASFVRGMFAKRGLSVKVGKPLTQVFVVDKGSFAITPKFYPEESFGHNLRVIDIDEDIRVPITCFRKHNISNPLAVLFYEEFKALAHKWK